MPRRPRSALVAAVTLLTVVACVQPQPRVPQSRRIVNLANESPLVAVEANGDIMFWMPPCSVTVRTIDPYRADGVVVTEEKCAEAQADATLTTPWGRNTRAPSSLPGQDGRTVMRFVADARNAPIDPLDRRTWKPGGRWKFSHPLLKHAFEWIPKEAELERIAYATGARLGIDATVAPAQQPPELSIESLNVTNGEILAGGASVFELTVKNRGTGPAYRVFATIRSSVPTLQGLQFSFGRLEPGASTTRYARVELAENTEDTTAMLVLVFHEANGFAPANFSRRFPVRVVATAPRLVLSCQTASGAVEVDAGETVRLRCTVRNDGGRPATGVSTIATVGGQRVASRAIDIAPRAAETLDLPVRIPVGAAIDQQLVIELVATEPAGGQRSSTTVAVTIRRPRVCPSGKLTRAEYRVKRTEIERARAAGDLTADEFDRYDAELVGCLDE